MLPLWLNTPRYGLVRSSFWATISELQLRTPTIQALPWDRAQNARPFEEHRGATISYHLSLNNIRETGILRIHLVPHDLAAAMNVSAIAFPPGVNEAEQAGLTLVDDGQPLPRVRGCPVAFHCRLQQWVEVGKQQGIAVAEVLNAFIEDHLVLNAERGHIDTPQLDLIARMHGSGW